MVRHHQHVGILARRHLCERRLDERGAGLDDHRTTHPVEPVLHEALHGLGDLPVGEGRAAAPLDIESGSATSTGSTCPPSPSSTWKRWCTLSSSRTVSMSASPLRTSRRCAASTVLAAAVSAAVNSCSLNGIGQASRARLGFAGTSSTGPCYPLDPVGGLRRARGARRRGNRSTARGTRVARAGPTGIRKFSIHDDRPLIPGCVYHHQ